MSRDLPGGVASIRRARDDARAFLVRVRPELAEKTVEDVLLAVSELVTNAVRHAPGRCTVRLAVDEQRVSVAVSDGSSSDPTIRPPRADGRGGYGLHLLRALAGDFEVRPDAGGKTVSVSLRRSTD
ncbi:MAG TPA: ATP-binding protein [Actinospica sp.]|nr:ATP-binding protein [Actinospica sp.]